MPSLDPDQIYHALMQAGNDWADKEAAANALEETKKSILSQVKANLGPDKSDAGAETLALCSQEYREHVRAMVEARRVANRAKVTYDCRKALMELRRSQESTRRAEATIR